VAKRIQAIENQPGRGGTRSVAAPDFHPDYRYVRADLRRIAILAGAFLSLLVLLSLVLD
jgi:hypothetical protein